MGRNNKYWQQRIGKLDTTPYHDYFDLRRIDDLDDEGLAYMLTHVKGINMLNLNETEITNESVKLLTTLEYVHELSLKGCYEIDGGCLESLNKLTTLTMLYVRNTGISIDDLMQLDGLTNLSKLLFSADDENALPEKMLLLRERFPNCEFVIDSVPYRFEED